MEPEYDAPELMQGSGGMRMQGSDAMAMQGSGAIRSLRSSFLRRVNDGFVTVHISGEPYGELDPTFVSEYSRELNEMWTIIDDHGTRHQVRFNGCYENPLLTDGWSNLREVYHMTHDHQVCFYYLGNSEFYVSHLPDHVPPHKYPTFHSRFPAQQQQGDCRMHFFEVRICPYIELEKCLVLPADLSDHIKKCNFRRLLLQGPLGEPVSCKCVPHQDCQHIIRITIGWRAFCKINKVKPGHKLIFGFPTRIEQLDCSNKIHVQVL